MLNPTLGVVLTINSILYHPDHGMEEQKFGTIVFLRVLTYAPCSGDWSLEPAELNAALWREAFLLGASLPYSSPQVPRALPCKVHVSVLNKGEPSFLQLQIW